MKKNLFCKFNDYHHTFIISEAGSNWKASNYEESLKRAKQLIRVASQAGSDAIKFQTYKPETVYAHNAGKSKYLSEHGISENIDDIFREFSMPYDMIPELAKYCKEENIVFMSTAFSKEDAKQLDPFVDIHKVASYEINHVRLLEYLAETEKPILISTGASTYKEIDFAVNLVKEKGNDMIGIMQCTAKYPCPLEALNLSVIPKIKSRYNTPVGFSDHSLDPMIGPLMAVGLGATFVEKHFTLDRSLAGPDHKFSLIPSELKIMIDSIRNADKTKGMGNKIVLEEEQELRQYALRSLQSIKKILRGEVLREGLNFDVLRPGNRMRGLDASYLDTVNGKKAIKDIEKGDGIIDYE